jgi:hypothetical protein
VNGEKKSPKIMTFIRDSLVVSVANDIMFSVLSDYSLSLGESLADECCQRILIRVKKLILDHLTLYSHILSSNNCENPLKLVDAIFSIQSLIRGFIARCKVRRIRIDRETEVDYISKHFYALVIQRYVRGWLCRRRRFDYKFRREFLEHVACTNRMVADNLKTVGIVNARRAKEEKDKSRREKIFDNANNQHHLLSTIVRPGVFNSAYSGRTVTDWGVPMETLIKDMRSNCT